jgi:hypothetical protein
MLFVDPELAEEIARRRAARPLARTLVVPTRLEALEAHEKHEAVRAARRARPLRNADPRKDTPLYTVLGWAKFELRAAALDPFRASHFAWIDLGLKAKRDHCIEDGVFASPSDRIRLLMMRPFTSGEIADPGYSEYLRGYVAAGYLTGSRANVTRLGELFARHVEDALAAGWAPSEEQLLPVLCTEHPDLFEFHYGDYPHLLQNYVHLRGSAPNLLFQMRVARDAGDFPRAHEIGRHVVAGHRSGAFVCEAAELAALLEECFIAAYYAEHPSQETAREISEIYMGLATNDADFRDVFLRDEIRVRTNFSFVSDRPTRDGVRVA